MKKLLKKVWQIFLRSSDNIMLGGAVQSVIEHSKINDVDGNLLYESRPLQIDWGKVISTLLTSSIPCSIIAYLFYKHILTLEQFSKIFLEVINQ